METSDVIADRLIYWGVNAIFVLPGDGINGMMEAGQGQVHSSQTWGGRAAFAGCAYSKFTGDVGVCLATSGSDGIHLLNDAHMDNRPVLAITGRTYAGLSVTKVDLEMYCESDIIGERIIAGISGRYSREFIRDSDSHGTEALIMCVGYQNIETV